MDRELDGREKLQMVFQLEDVDHLTRLGELNTKIRKNFEVSDLYYLSVLTDRLRERGVRTIQVAGGSVALDTFFQQVKDAGKWNLRFEADGLSFRFGRVSALKFEFVIIEQISRGEFSPWDEWLSIFLTDDKFSQAWIVDAEYDHWQNAEDPIEYQAAGKSCTNLPKISNNLPFPLERENIDISKNPGRRILKPGYVEVVASKIWLSRRLLRRLGKSVEQVLCSAGSAAIDVNENVIMIFMGDSPFCIETDGRLQENLRSLIYPQ